MSKANILVIEDEKFVLDSIERFLKQEGYEVAKAMNRQEAYDQLDAHNFDLIITDIMLPHLGGFDIIDYIREHERTAGVPILVSTGMDQEIFNATLHDADDYITKPYDISDLLKKVKDMLTVKS